MKRTLYKSSLIVMVCSLMLTFFNFSIIRAQEAQATPLPDVEGLELNKYATKNADGTYTLNLEAYAEGKVTVETKSKPLDIVLVLDQSGSMDYGIKSQYTSIEVYIDKDDTFASDVINPNHDYYIKDSNNQYITVKKDRWHSLGFTGYFVWKDANGNEVVPTNRDGSSVDAENIYASKQFYDNYFEYTGKKRMEVLKDAANSFVDKVKENGDHRVAIVGFADGDTNSAASYNNTELFIGADEYRYGAAGLNDAYGKSLQSINTEAGYKNIKASIGKLSSAGATRSDLGMELAKNIFTKNENGSEDRDKVVIMFTDGTPTTSNVFDENVANAAIKWSSEMKNSGAKVFTVGVEESLNPSDNPELTSTNNINKYMHYVSSNFPNAESLSKPGTGNYLDKKFLSANDEASLLAIFESIREEISSSSVTLDENTQLVDYISDYFEITNASDIKVFTQDYLGKDASGNKQWSTNETPFPNAIIAYDEVKKTIQVSGFDYSKEYIADTTPPIGKRVVLQVKVKVKDGFLGGEQVPTNTVEAGIYGKDILVERFPMPKVDVDLNYTLSANDKSIYIGSAANMSGLFDTNSISEGIQFKNDKGEFTLDGINNQFVDTTFTVVDKKTGKVVGTYTVAAKESKVVSNDDLLKNVTENMDVEIKVDLKSINGNKAFVDTKEAKVNVFTPIVNVVDSVNFLGEFTSLNDNVYDVHWVCANPSATTPMEVTPTLTHSFSKEGSTVMLPVIALKDTSLFTVSTKNGTQDITAYTKVENANTHANGDFQVQIVKGELAITKEIDRQYTEKQENNAEQSFRFKIDVRDEKDGTIKKTYYQTIQFSANEDVTHKTISLQGLSKGYYTVSEVDNWSWNYQEESNRRLDNYNANGTTAASSENSAILIGDQDTANTNGKRYYGSAANTVINGKQETNVATMYFANSKIDKSIFGDVASAINKFVTK